MATFRLMLVLVFSTLPLFPTMGAAESVLERLTVMALAPLDSHAVMKWPNGAMHLIQRGDRLQGTTATLVQVLPDKLVVEEHLTRAGSAPRKRLVWIYKAPRDGGYSRIVRLQRDLTPHRHSFIPTMPSRPRQKP